MDNQDQEGLVSYSLALDAGPRGDVQIERTIRVEGNGQAAQQLAREIGLFAAVFLGDLDGIAAQVEGPRISVDLTAPALQLPAARVPPEPVTPPPVESRVEPAAKKPRNRKAAKSKPAPRKVATPKKVADPGANYFGTWLKAERESRDLSQARFGGLIGTSNATISAWERGKNEPRDDQVLGHLAELTGVTLDTIKAMIAGRCQHPGELVVAAATGRGPCEKCSFAEVCARDQDAGLPAWCEAVYREDVILANGASLVSQLASRYTDAQRQAVIKASYELGKAGE